MVAALELTSRNIMCGSLRMVYAFIYTLFLVRLTLQRCSIHGLYLNHLRASV